MSERVVIFLSTGGYEAAWQATSLALTAQAMGDQVLLVVGFGALRALGAGTFGAPEGEVERASAERGAAINAATPARMLEDARGLGLRAVACDTTVRLCGLEPGQLEREGRLDEVQGLAQIWRAAQQARVLSF